MTIAVNSDLKNKELEKSGIEAPSNNETTSALNFLAAIFVYGGFVLGLFGTIAGVIRLNNMEEQWIGAVIIFSGLATAVGLCATGYVIKLLLQIEENTRK